MAGKPFDATMKDLMDADGVSWTALASSTPPRRVSFEDADVSSVTAAADKVLRVEDDSGEWLLNIEPESSHAPGAPHALHLYSTLLEHRHGLKVRSVLLLLRPEANATAASGVLVRKHADEKEPYLIFRYRVVRLWEEPLARFLDGGLGTLPLAALTDEARGDLSGVVERIDARLRAEASPELAARLRSATYLLLGLRYEEHDIAQAFEGVNQMIEESTTYQGILRRGREAGELAEARRMLLRLGQRMFTQPADAATTARLESITDLNRLRALAERLLDVSSWEELLAEG